MSAPPGPEIPPQRPPSALVDGDEHPWRTLLATLSPLLWVLSLLLVVAALLAGTLASLLGTEAGARWALAQVPGLEVRGWQGALLSGRWRADQILLRYDQGRGEVRLDEVEVAGLAWQWRPHGAAWVGLGVDRLQIGTITVRTGPPGPRPIVLPASVALPVGLSVRAAGVGRLQVDELPAATGLRLEDLRLDTRPDGAHRVERLALTLAGVQAEARARVGTRAPLALDINATLAPAEGSTLPPWRATVQVSGDAARTRLDAQLDGPPAATRGSEPVRATLAATLTPLEAWPLERLALRSRALDLAALHARAPQTRIDGEATLAMRSRDAPAALRIDLANTRPGPWSAGRLPIRKLTADLSGSLAEPDRIDLGKAELLLADGAGDAGRVQLSGRWQGAVLALEARLRDLRLKRLAPEAPALRLDGPLRLAVSGLPSPDGSAGPPPAGGPVLSAELDLVGQLADRAQSVRLMLQLEGSERRLEVSRLRATAGSAIAEAQLTLERASTAARADWRLATSGSVVEFDPLVWWPGEAGSAWRRGAHRLSGGWQFDGRLPHGAEALAPLELLHRVAGNGVLRLQDSVLAGVAVSGSLSLGYTQAAAPTSALLRGDLRAGGNQLRLEGRVDPSGDGSADRWTADLRADALPGLAPLFELQPGLAAWTPRRGSVAVQLSAAGRWPALDGELRLQVSQLQAGELQLAHGRSAARIDTRGAGRVAADLDFGGIVWRTQRADHLRGRVDGTLAEHRIDLAGAAPVLPPALVLQLAGVSAQSGTRARLRALGGWRERAGGGGSWRAQVEQLQLGAWDGSHDDVPPASLWAEARDLAVKLDFDAGFGLDHFEADAGRLRLADVASLRWDAVQIDLDRPRTDFSLRADIEPFALAPLLKRLQPTIGWEGDLQVAARLDLKAGERFDAEVALERTSGDLHIQSSEGLLLLGLTEVRLGLVAHDGRWAVTPQFRGRSLGEIGGTVMLRTSAAARVPPRDAVLSGQVQARVADIGIWGAWVPAGWRLAGEIGTELQLSGTLGQPRLTGDLRGQRIAVRNLLQGINVSDGQLALRLEGERARIESFRLKGGDGTLELSGEGTLAGGPSVRLGLVAERFRVLGRVDRQVVASGRADFEFGNDRGRLDGRFTVDEALFDASAADAPSLDDDVTLMRPGDGDGNGNGGAPAPRRNFQLALELDLGEQFRVKGRGVDTGLRGALRLSTPQGRLAANGSIRTHEGTYAAYGQKLELERGIVIFTGPVDDPRLDILALRPDIDLRVGVAITGTVQAPRVRLYADPEMGDTEKLSWLVLGREPDGLGRNDTALLQRAALALLAGEGEAPTDQLLGRLGIDNLSLRQDDGDVRETVVTLGKQLSRRWYLGYERGINAAAGTWQLIYRVAQRFTLRAQSGLENSLDMIWTWRLQETPADAGMRKSTIKPP
jgi:translocation and assembly module TamB